MRLEEILLLAQSKTPPRGHDLFRDNAVEKTQRHGETYSARVQGSASQPYRVEIDLDAGEWRCTCPYEHGAVCKHVYAVALAALEAPEVFTPAKRRSPKPLEAAVKAVAKLHEDDVYKLLESLEELHPEVLAEYAANLERRRDDW